MAEEYQKLKLENVDFSNAKVVKETGAVHAMRTVIGEEVASLNRNVQEENKLVAKQQGDRAVTTQEGEQDLVRQSQFVMRYKPKPGSVGENVTTYVATGVPVQIVKVNENVQFETPAGDTLKVRKGGAIAKLNDNEFYAIRPEELASSRYVEVKAPSQTPGNAPKPKP